MLQAVPDPGSSGREAPRTGPRPLFEDLYRGSRDDLYAYVAGLLRDRVTAEDVTALAFERAFRKWERFDPKRGTARGWLFGIARNAALDELRKRKRETPAIEPDGFEALDSAAGGSRSGATTVGAATRGSSVEQRVVALEQRAKLLAALGMLAPTDREMVALKFFAGLSNVEIAETTGYSPTNVGTRLSRAMTRLRNVLETDGFASSEEVAR